MEYDEYERFIADSACATHIGSCSSDADTCCICYESLLPSFDEDQGEEERCSAASLAIVRLGCGHLYHNACVLRMLDAAAKNGGRRPTKCPKCRHPTDLQFPLCFQCGNPMMPSSPVTTLHCCQVKMHLACSRYWFSSDDGNSETVKHPSQTCEVRKKLMAKNRNSAASNPPSIDRLNDEESLVILTSDDDEGEEEEEEEDLSPTSPFRRADTATNDGDTSDWLMFQTAEDEEEQRLVRLRAAFLRVRERSLARERMRMNNSGVVRGRRPRRRRNDMMRRILSVRRRLNFV